MKFTSGEILQQQIIVALHLSINLANFWKDFINMFISLIGSLYKILAKVLANRIKTVLPRIISVTQSAFIGGRNILDGVLIANEIVDGWKKNRKSGIVLKPDFERAYDSINWNFLFTMLSNFGFGVK